MPSLVSTISGSGALVALALDPNAENDEGWPNALVRA